MSWSNNTEDSPNGQNNQNGYNDSRTLRPDNMSGEVHLYWSNNSQHCYSIQELLPDIVDNVELQVIFGALYTIVCIVGIAGNAFVLYSIFYKGLLFNVRRIFISSLACSDIIIGVTSLPITAISTFTRNWHFGASLCHIIGFIQGSHIFISSFTLISIAVDRYLLVKKPYTIKVTYSCATKVVFITWCMGYSLATPLAHYVTIRNYPSADYPELCGTFCEEVWPDDRSRMVYGFIVLAVQFGLPLIANSVCYVGIHQELRRRFVRRKSTQTIFLDTHRRLSRRRRRTTFMTTTMLVSFLLAWMPLNFLNVTRDFNLFEGLLPTHYFSILFAAGHLVAMTSIIWNPLIYMGFQESFRQFITHSAASCTVSTTTF